VGAGTARSSMLGRVEYPYIAIREFDIQFDPRAIAALEAKGLTKEDIIAALVKATKLDN
jgi:hypothetical protein